MKKISAGGKIFIAAGLILLAAAVHYILFNVVGLNDGRALVMNDTGKSVSYDISVGAQFYSWDDGSFYFCTKDGIEYISSDGESQWKGIFSLTKPIIVTAGEMIAVGDAMGKYIYVFNSKGLVFSVELTSPVLTFSVNRTGYLSVILQLDSGYAAHIYSSRNNVEPLAFYELHDALMHPVSIDVSEDGRFAVIAMWNLNVRFASRVTFHYVNETDAWSAVDAMGMFFAKDYPDEAVHNVRFMSENRALVFSDKRMSCFQPGEANACAELWNHPLHNETGRPVFYNGNSFAVAMGDELLNDPAASGRGDVHIYNVDGERTGEFKLGQEATFLSMAHDSVIVGAGRRFYALNRLGQELWNHSADFDVQGLYFLNNTDTVLVAGNTDAQIMRREKEKEETAATEEVLPEGDLEIESD